MDHALADAKWALIAPKPPPERGRVGHPTFDDRPVVLNAVLWVIRSGARWIDVPPQWGRWKSIYRRYRRWAE